MAAGKADEGVAVLVSIATQSAGGGGGGVGGKGYGMVTKRGGNEGRRWILGRGSEER